jgi:hypothetical protein
VRERERMTKTIKFISTMIIFFSLFLTTVPNSIPYKKCEVVNDCYEEFDFVADDLEFLKSHGKQVVCQNGFCRIIPF